MLSETGPNPPADARQSAALDEYFRNGVQSHFCAGPFSSKREMDEAFNLNFRVNPVFAVHSGNKDRAVVNFSSPREGVSVNDSLLPGWATVSYIQLGEVVRWMESLGPGGWIWIADLKDAYLQLKVHPRDRHLMAVSWDKKFYAFLVLMLGLSTAPRIFTIFADCIMRIIIAHQPSIFDENGKRGIFHYLDDFFGGHSSRRGARRQFRETCETLDSLNVPFKPSKAIAPARSQVILGIRYDLPSQQLSMPSEKAERYIALCAELLLEELVYVTKARLRSLSGKLRYAATALFGGQAFVRAMETARPIENLPGPPTVKMSAAIRNEAKFWVAALPQLTSGIPFDWVTRSHSELGGRVCTDASSLFGLGAVCSNGQFFRVKWTDLWPGTTSVDIYFGEMLAVWLALSIWAPILNTHTAHLWVDNKCVVAALTSFKAKSERASLNYFIRDLVLDCNRNKVRFRCQYIASEDNVFADALSRGIPLDNLQQKPEFGVGFPRTEVPIPPQTLCFLSENKRMWNSAFHNIVSDET